METMKYPNVPGGNNMAVSSGNGGNHHVEDVETVFSSSCWSNSSTNLHNEFIDQKLMSLESPISNLSAADKMLEASITESESDALDSFLMNTQPINSSLAELKPLPPFAGYTANLSINGIQGHHYHALAQRITEENNNSYNNFNEQNIVSSSTCNVSNENDCDTKEVLFAENEFEVKLSYDMVDSVVTSGKVYDECGQQQNSAVDSVTHIKTEVTHYDVSAIDDIAAIISSAISADTSPTQQQQNNNATSHCGGESDNPGSRDSWMDLDSWINRACVDEQKNLVVTQDGLSEFVVPTTTNQAPDEFKSPNSLATPTLQNLLSYMPLLQNRLQNGPPPKQELPSSTNYTGDIISTSSPPANVVSTTENLLLTVNGRFVPNYGIQQHLNAAAADDRMQSPDMLQNYPHTTTTTTTVTPKKSRNRTQKKQTNNSSSSVYPSEQNLGLLGKEKPVHRCTICNRGFLNKSNIKVHLRTHTGEKPFRCDTCAKAFRQKAHLLKHQQIHKRIGRD